MSTTIPTVIPSSGDGLVAQAAAMMTNALNWAYDQAASDLPLIGGAVALAESHEKGYVNHPDPKEAAIDDLIAWQIAYAGATGFASNIGGVITLPVAIPANLAGVLVIQLRMLAAIAHLRGYDITDPKVRTVAFLCMIGDAAGGVVKGVGVAAGGKLAANMLKQVPGALLVKINQAVGFRLATKAGTTGLINLSKFVPIVGGLIGGGFDAVITRAIAATAKEAFIPVVQQAPSASSTPNSADQGPP